MLLSGGKSCSMGAPVHTASRRTQQCPSRVLRQALRQAACARMPSAWQAIAHRTRRAGPLYAVEPEDSDDALLLCGFLPEETEVVSVMLRELGADFVKLVVCCPGMENLPLGDALLENQSPADRRRPALGVPRILFISGMTSEEVSMLIDAFLELELPATLFAAAVPRSMDKPLAQLFDEITGDHERLLQQQREPV